MSNKNFINELNSKLEAFRYFEDERLKMLLIGVNLQIAIRDIQENGYSKEGLDTALAGIKNAYDTMYSKYELASIKVEELRNDCRALSAYTLDLEKQLRATEEI
jgi:hypothetical protein